VLVRTVFVVAGRTLRDDVTYDGVVVVDLIQRLILIQTILAAG